MAADEAKFLLLEGSEKFAQFWGYYEHYGIRKGYPFYVMDDNKAVCFSKKCWRLKGYNAGKFTGTFAVWEGSGGVKHPTELDVNIKFWDIDEYKDAGPVKLELHKDMRKYDGVNSLDVDGVKPERAQRTKLLMKAETVSDLQVLPHNSPSGSATPLESFARPSDYPTPEQLRETHDFGFDAVRTKSDAIAWKARQPPPSPPTPDPARRAAPATAGDDAFQDADPEDPARDDRPAMGDDHQSAELTKGTPKVRVSPRRTKSEFFVPGHDGGLISTKDRAVDDSQWETSRADPERFRKANYEWAGKNDQPGNYTSTKYAVTSYKGPYAKHLYFKKGEEPHRPKKYSADERDTSWKPAKFNVSPVYTQQELDGTKGGGREEPSYPSPSPSSARSAMKSNDSSSGRKKKSVRYADTSPMVVDYDAERMEGLAAKLGLTAAARAELAECRRADPIGTTRLLQDNGLTLADALIFGKWAASGNGSAGYNMMSSQL